MQFWKLNSNHKKPYGMLWFMGKSVLVYCGALYSASRKFRKFIEGYFRNLTWWRKNKNRFRISEKNFGYIWITLSIRKQTKNVLLCRPCWIPYWVRNCTCSCTHCLLFLGHISCGEPSSQKRVIRFFPFCQHPSFTAEQQNRADQGIVDR
jgi:hypothetical protein